MFTGPLSFMAAAGGGAASAGAGAAASSLAFLSPIGIGLGVAGFALSAFQTAQQNKQIKKRNKAVAESAQSQLAAANENITSLRRVFYDQTNMASGQARENVARYQNAQGFTSGASLDEYIAQKVGDTYVDQLARKTALADQLKQIEYNKQTIAAQARAGMASGSSPVLSGLTGALQGYQLGSGLEDAYNSFQRVRQVNTALETLRPLANSGDATALAQMQAIQSGLPVGEAMNRNSPFLGGYLTNNEIQSLQLQSLRDSAANAANIRSLTEGQLRSLQGMYAPYQPKAFDPFLNWMR